MRRSEFEASIGTSSYRLIPRFATVQSSGKKRVIDDAAKGGQCDLSQDSNKLKLCSALRPAHHLVLVKQAAENHGAIFEETRLNAIWRRGLARRL